MKTIFKSLILATLLCSPMLRGAISVNDNISGINLGGGGGGGGGDALTTNPLSQFAATTSSQLAGVLTDETGSGAACFATSPTFVTPILGTPTSATLTNATGLPLSTGVIGTLAQTKGGAGADISAVSGVLVNTAGTISGVTAASANTASAIVQRDSSKNFLANNVGTATTSITTSGGTTTLTAASTRRQRFGGASNQNVVLPDATTLGQTGFSFLIDNRSSGTITIKDASSNTLYTVPTLTEATIVAGSIGSVNGSWEIQTAAGQPATDSAAGYLSAADHAAYTATGTTVSAATNANTASAIVKRTADGNVWVTGAQQKATSTATAAGTTTLTVADSPIQIWTGATTQTIKMPAANTLVQIGATYRFINKSSGTLTIQDNSAGAITTVPTNTSADIVVTNIGSAAGTWIADAAAAGSSPSLTNTYVGFGASSVLSGSADFTFDDTNKSLFLNTAAASTGPRLMQFTHGTQTGTTSTDGVIMGYPTANSSVFTINQQEASDIQMYVNANQRMRISTTASSVKSPDTNTYIDISNAGIQLSAPLMSVGPLSSTRTAYLHINAGTATASTAPLKLTSGTNLTTPEAGAIEYDGKFWASPSTATERFAILQPTGASKPTCSVTYRGQHWVTPGGAGVADVLEFCLKDAADAYAWVTK